MSNLSTYNYNKLKTNLRLAIHRLKLAAKKKTELAQHSRKEIATYLQQDKVDRARIRVEHVIHEDYLVEAMDIVEMYCDTLLARFGMVEQLRTLEEDLAEAVFSLLWAAPRLQSEVKELKVIADLLTSKYGTRCVATVKEHPTGSSVNAALMFKLGVQSPPKALVERYLIEIARIFAVPYKPDEVIIRDDERYRQNNNNNLGFSSLPPPPLPSQSLIDFGTFSADQHPLAPPLAPIGFNLLSPGTVNPLPSFSQAANLSAKKPNSKAVITDFDESLFPPVPSSSEDTESTDVHGEQDEGPQNGKSISDSFEDIKRRFAALKKKK